MGILKHLEEKIKIHKEEMFVTFIIVFSCILGFGLGRLSKIEERKTPITITQTEETSEDFEDVVSAASASFVASKNGTKYYFPWCEGVKKISKANIIEFASREEAEKAGYSKAANCVGL